MHSVERVAVGSAVQSGLAKTVFAVAMASFEPVGVAGEGDLAKVSQPVAVVAAGSFARDQESTVTAVFELFAMADPDTAAAAGTEQQESDRTTLAVGLGRRTAALNTACANGSVGTWPARKWDTAAGAEVPDLGDFQETSARARSGSCDRLGCHTDRAGCNR